MQVATNNAAQSTAIGLLKPADIVSDFIFVGTRHNSGTPVGEPGYEDGPEAGLNSLSLGVTFSPDIRGELDPEPPSIHPLWDCMLIRGGSKFHACPQGCVGGLLLLL